MRNDIALYEKIPAENNSFPIRLFRGSTNYLPYHWHEHLEILYVLNGECDFFCGRKSFKIKKSDIIIVNGNELHHFENDITSPIEYYCIMINPDFFSDIKFENTIFISDIGNDKCAERYIKEAVFEQSRAADGYDLKIKALISLLIVHLMRNYKITDMSNSAYDTYTEKLRKLNAVLNFIDNNYAEKISAKELSELAYMSEGYFHHYFKKVVGLTLTDYINNLRIKKAANMIKNTNASITEIALSSGYSDINYFSRVFKKIMKLTPTEYKNKSAEA